MKKIIVLKGETTSVNGTEPPNTCSRDELDGVTKEEWEWAVGKFPKVKRKILNIGRFIVYGTANKNKVNTKI